MKIKDIKLKSLYFFLLFAIIIQAHTAIMSPRVSSDGLQQYIISLPVLEGKGISMQEHHNYDDISEIYYRSYVNWAPGWNLSILPFIKVGLNPILIFSITKALGIILLLTSLFSLLNRHFSNNKTAISLFFIFIAFASIPIEISGATDVISLGFLFLFINYYDKKREQLNIFSSVLIGVLLFLPCFFRYAYYPICLGIGLFLIFMSFINKNTIKKPHFLMFFVFLIFLGVQSLFMDYFTNTGGGGITKSGFYLSGLLSMNPFFAQSFFPRHLFVLISERFFNITDMKILYWSYFATGFFIALVAAYGLFYAFIKYFRLKDIFNIKVDYKWLLLIANVAMLSFFLYTRTKSEFRGYDDYYRVIRYFSIAHISLQLLFFYFIFYSKTKILRALSTIIVIVGFLMFTSHWLYLKTKTSLLNYKENLITMVPPQGVYKEYSKVYKEIKNNPNQTIVTRQRVPRSELVSAQEEIKGIDGTIHFFGAIGGASFIDRDSIPKFSLNTSKPVDLYLLNPKDTTIQFYEKIIKEKKGEKVLDLPISGFDMYKIKLRNQD